MPVISTAAAAPAFAALSDVFTISRSAAVDPTNSRSYIDVTVTITNEAGGGLAALGAIVSVTSITSVPAGVTVASASTPTGWTVTDPLPLTYGITYGSSIENSTSTSVTIRFKFLKKPGKGDAVTVSGTVTVPNFTPNQRSFTVTVTAPN